VAAAMMEEPGGTALVEESIAEALDFRRAMRKVGAEMETDPGTDWWFKVWGPVELADEGMGDREDWMLRAGEHWHGFGDLAPEFNLLDPIKATIITPGLDVDGDFADWGIPAAILTKYLAEHGVIVEKTGLYSFFIMFTIGITKGRWNTMVTELQQFKDDYDRNQPLWRIMPDFVAKSSPLRAHRPQGAVHGNPRGLQGQRCGPPDHRDVPVRHGAGHAPGRRLRPHGPPGHRTSGDRRPGRPHHLHPADPLPARHPPADSRRALQRHHRPLPEVHP
jgi:hypothetical protein